MASFLKKKIKMILKTRNIDVELNKSEFKVQKKKIHFFSKYIYFLIVKKEKKKDFFSLNSIFFQMILRKKMKAFIQLWGQFLH